MCFDLGPFSSGCSTSTTYNTNVSASVSAVSQALQQITTTSSNTVTLTNNFSLVLNGCTVLPCTSSNGTQTGISVTQTINGSFTFLSNVNAQENDSIVSALQNSVSSQLSQLTTAQQGLLAGALSASSTANVTQTLNNSISSYLTQQTTTNILNSVVNNNNATINLTNCTLPCITVDQNILINMAATAIVGAVTTAVANTTQGQALISVANQSTSSSATGVDAIVGDVVNGIESLASDLTAGYIVLIIVIAAVILGAGYLVVKLIRGSGKGKTTVNLNGGANTPGYNTPAPTFPATTTTTTNTTSVSAPSSAIATTPAIAAAPVVVGSNNIYRRYGQPYQYSNRINYRRY